MIESILIDGFQKHERRFIAFDPLVTVFTGPTDCGKSSALRALRWVCLNQPSGDDFISWGRDYSRVVLKVDNKKLTRKKGRGTNSYKLGAKPFKALGQGGVPQEVFDFLNLSPENFQCQLDPPFWFGATPGEVSKELNAIVSLDLIDKVLSGAQASLKKAKATVVLTEERLVEAEGKLSALSWLGECDGKLRLVEEEEEGAREARLGACRLRPLIEGGERASRELDGVSRAILGAGKALTLGERAEELRGEADELHALLERVAPLRGELERLGRERAAKEEELAFLPEEKKCPACGRLMGE